MQGSNVDCSCARSMQATRSSALTFTSQPPRPNAQDPAVLGLDILPQLWACLKPGSHEVALPLQQQVQVPPALI